MYKRNDSHYESHQYQYDDYISHFHRPLTLTSTPHEPELPFLIMYKINEEVVFEPLATQPKFGPAVKQVAFRTYDVFVRVNGKLKLQPLE